MQKLVLFRFMRFSEGFRHSFTSFGANFRIWLLRLQESLEGIVVRNRGKESWDGRNGPTTQSFLTVWTTCLGRVRKT